MNSDLTTNNTLRSLNEPTTIDINGDEYLINGIPDNFVVNDGGLYQIVDESYIYISAQIFCLGYVKNAEHKTWERKIAFKDFEGQWQSIVLPMNETSSSANKLAQHLSYHGLHFVEGQKKKLYDYVLACNPSQRFISVNKPGWYGDTYVSPKGGLFGRYIYNAPSNMQQFYQQSGELEQWKNNVAALCAGNSRLMFSVSVVFCSLILPLIDGQCCVFHLYNKSSTGKSSALKLAMSVLGKGLMTWHTTDNALEEFLQRLNHSAGIFDEIAQLPKNKLSEVIYMVCNGEGRARFGQTDKRNTWLNNCLSSGEFSIKSALTDSKQGLYEGQEVRFVDICADAGEGHGVLDDIHNYPDSGAAIEALNCAVDNYYGTAGQYFTDEVMSDKELCTSLALDFRNEFLEKINVSELDSIERRVASNFANVVAAGKLATDLGITGWPLDEVVWAGEECFRSWQDSRENSEAEVLESAVTTIQAKLMRASRNKFISQDNPTPKGHYWGKREGNNYFIFTDVFNNTLCAGMDFQKVRRVLVNHGYITSASDRRDTVLKRIDGTVTRCVHVNETLFNTSLSFDDVA
ncbi:DUF927 domain-containing protein [Thalassomonas sp. M1454]|uniref:DUF927 domain-containing protein n=1 Tax=Thalassomonas sp. M1454 TaxID=2594477 RepID=UPI00117F0784|nr:DUF927 domain-containing protein [Thalassomonas sp. M1454]TRX52753.1 DUF927 domain-containing protein [Thalassomonas sp. M1454]